MSMPFLANLDIFTFGLIAAAMLIFGFIIFLNDRGSSTNRTFFAFSLITVAYGLVNYFNYQFTEPKIVLWLLRFVLFTSVWHAFCAFHLFYVFPERKVPFPVWYRWILFPAVAVVSVITLTPLTFVGLEGPIILGQVANPERGPGMAVFGVLVMVLVIGGVIKLVRKTMHASNANKAPFRWVVSGTVITFLCIIGLNVIMPLVFNVVKFVPFAPAYFIPFILFTGIAIVKHHLLDVKIVASEILAMLLGVVTLVDVFVATGPSQTIVRFFVFWLVIIFGLMLVKGVQREVAQTQALQKLTKDLRSTNRRLRELDKMKSEFLSFASHQVKTPMTVVKGYASMIIDGSFGTISDEVKKVATQIMRASETMIALVNNLLDMGRLEEGRMEYTFETTSFSQLVSQVVEGVRPLAQDKGLELSYRSKASEAFVSIDKQKFQQVVQNLVENAIKYTPKGKIDSEVSFVPDARHEVQLRVSDTGIGIHESLISQLFAKFTRGKGEAKKIQGTGLGLYIAKQIVLAHKGKIFVTSHGEGLGSTFTVVLPTVSAPKEQPAVIKTVPEEKK